MDNRRHEHATVVGAGICGSWSALLLREAGLTVSLHERGGADMTGASSYWAGGMLAPGAESDSAEPIVIDLGRRSVELWQSHFPETTRAGSIVVAHPRDRGDLVRFERQTSGHRRLDGPAIAEVEPALAGRFTSALFFADEAHVEPRAALPAIHRRLAETGTEIRFGSEVCPGEIDGLVIDCRGLAARDDAEPELRGVKGETVLVESDEIDLRRPVRLMHPRWPIYVIPRPGGRFLIGASTIEREDGGVSVRSALELLTAAYTIHPAFGEARILELGTGLRPAYPDHAPRITIRGDRIDVNGLYRHGFLLAPALAEIVAAYVTAGTRRNEVMRWS